MTLTLRAVSLNDQPLTQPITAQFDAQGGTIGRADQNIMALPDPERHISRQQAQISLVGSAYRIKNVGSANPILARGQALAQGESAPLAHGDQVRIGGYLLEVIEQREDDVSSHTLIRSRPAAEARSGGFPGNGPTTPRHAASGAPQGGSVAADLGAPLSSSNPFADLLGPATPAPLGGPQRHAAEARTGPPPAQASPPPPLIGTFSDLMPPPRGVPSSSAGLGSPPAAPSLLPDDFDPFAAPSPRSAPAAPKADRGNAARGAFADLIPSPAPSSLDAMFGLEPGRGDPLAAFMAGTPVARAGGEPLPGAASIDPMALFGDVPPPARPVAPSQPDHTPALQGAFKPPAIERPRPMASAEPIAASASASATATPDALWLAFCEGAGVRQEAATALTPEAMRGIGEMLRAAVDGSLQLMAVRAATKHELRAQVTVIQARNNNPLKFSPDAQSALEQLLQPPLRGFLAGPAAMTDAMHDLVGHSIGTMAGMRAALEGVLDRFAPQALEAKLSSKSLLDSLLPMNRKAKLWELYLQHAQVIRNEAQDDFEALFGKAFLAAYEQQLERLQAPA